ncbi:MAG: Rieske 2Fe-2S domain-containing protein [Rhodospirillales bacterium]
MFLRNQWYVAAESRELGDAPLGRIFLDEPVVLYRQAGGAPVALADRCRHRHAPLSRGAVADGRLRCGYHGFVYDATGACVAIPGRDRIPPGTRVRAYPLCERHGWIWIWMGDAARADDALVPDFRENAAPGWAAVGARLPVRADYRLLIDNLMDLSHVAFVHAATIGSPDDTDPQLVWERGPGWVRGTRTVRNIAPSPRMRHEGIDYPVDQVKTMTFTPPANVVIDIRTVEAGRAPGAPGRLNQRLIIFDMMTPETGTSCHYFWSNARNYAVDDRAYTDFAQRLVEQAFDEDKAMLEAQQRNLDRDPEAPSVDVGADTGGLQSRRLLARLIEEERAKQTAA